MNDRPPFLNTILSAKGEPTSPNRGGDKPHKETSGKEPTKGDSEGSRGGKHKDHGGWDGRG